jgi:hypothetical protein
MTTEDIEQARRDASIDFNDANAAWWDQWLSQFGEKVYPIFREHGYSLTEAAGIYCQKHTQLRMAEVQEDIAHLVKMIGELKVVKLDDSDDDNEPWQRG